MTNNGRRPTVLVVDDEAEVRQLVRVVLGTVDYDVVEAADGADALALLEQRNVDLVLLDLRMPVLDGWGVIERMRATRVLDRVPVLTLSAHSDPALVRRALAAGCRGSVSKPFMPDELRNAVREVLGG